MRAKVGQWLILCPSSPHGGQLMTQLGSDFPPGAGVLGPGENRSEAGAGMWASGDGPWQDEEFLPK